ncbi:MAG: alternative ribosome rescue aminoacyl-tRNA hydrolase ArfB [Lysobacterales bacterium]
MLIVSAQIEIPESELTERFVRAQGPGGQNVNKVASAVELRFDARASRALPEAVRERLLQRADRRINGEGVVVIQANRFRSQEQNREDARARLIALIRAATSVPKKRVPTKPTRAARERRIGAKRQRAGVKASRGRPPVGGE